MYDELIAELRRHHCDAKEDDTQEVCEECAYDVIIADKSVPSGIASVCVCGLMNRAADAIEELSKRVPSVPHGRLIDGDALTTVTEMVNGEWKTYVEVFEIADAPTIIEAEPTQTNTSNTLDALTNACPLCKGTLSGLRRSGGHFIRHCYSCNFDFPIDKDGNAIRLKEETT